MAKPKFFIYFLAFLLQACAWGEPRVEQGSTQKEYAKPIERDFNEIVNDGVLNVLIENTSTTFFIYKGQPMGFEYELISAFAKSHNLKISLKVLSDFDSIKYWLNTGLVDVVASNLTVTQSRKKDFLFTEPILKSHQVLVQRKGDAELKKLEDLNGKRIWVHKSSAFFSGLKQLKKERKIDFELKAASSNYTTENLIKMVSEGEINFTVSDNQTAKLNAMWLGNLSAKLKVSENEDFAWALRKNNKDLLDSLNSFLGKNKKLKERLKKRYFNSSKSRMMLPFSDFSSLGGSSISDYDNLFKKAAEKVSLDWRLIAAVAYKESKFDPNAKSWAGAFGLMQLMPPTAEELGIDSLASEYENILAGSRYLKRMYDFWSEKIDDEAEVLNFALASYNVGIGHVLDARAIADYYGKDTNVWRGSVEWAMNKKTNPNYYTKPFVRFGYCRASEPINYVEEVTYLYTRFLLMEN